MSKDIVNTLILVGWVGVTYLAFWVWEIAAVATIHKLGEDDGNLDTSKGRNNA